MEGGAKLATDALARGNLISAYDCATSAIADGDESSLVRHLQVLALARMGDTDRALALFSAYRLDASVDPHERALGARLLKDRALRLADGEERQEALRSALESYHLIYLESGDSFPGINAATLALLAGDVDRSRHLASGLLARLVVASDEDYYSAATRAEALLLVGRLSEAVDVLAAPAVRQSVNFGARSSTRRQLSLIGARLGLEGGAMDRLLAPLVPPVVAHLCGHMFAADAEAEVRIRGSIDFLLDRENVGFVYGALACGSDLLFAEAALARGAELHVVLPFDETDFLDQSVRPGGEGWEKRFRACMEAASSRSMASDTEYFGDPAQYSHSARMAMGMARLRARHLGADVVQLAIWDEHPSDGPAGTGADVASWRASGGRTVVLDPGPIDRALVRPGPRIRSGHERGLAAILFTDFAGFSTLGEASLPAFWGGVMRAVADVLDSYGSEIVCRNSWGDALYAVADSAPAAARVALEIQDVLSTYDYTALRLAGDGGMRIAAHYGPAYRAADPITGRTTFYGSEVSKAARIEPVTPPGAVFVTEPFAAVLELEAGREFTCAYVGRIPLAKKYGEYPMYRLTRVSPAS